MPTKNVGGADKGIRIVLGLVLAGVGYYYSMWWAVILGVLVLVTGLIGWCALYKLLKVNTCKVSGPAMPPQQPPQQPQM